MWTPAAWRVVEDRALTRQLLSFNAQAFGRRITWFDFEGGSL